MYHFTLIFLYVSVDDYHGLSFKTWDKVWGCSCQSQAVSRLNSRVSFSNFYVKIKIHASLWSQKKPSIRWKSFKNRPATSVTTAARVLLNWSQVSIIYGFVSKLMKLKSNKPFNPDSTSIVILIQVSYLFLSQT